ncbi:MAG: phosphatidate cytidylyltransferase [Chloroflexi bacterium]|nr:MAG: phosphatidate cytidylyltransferase [Chloroflexota bacterium]
MKQRIIVGLVALPVVLIPVWLGGVWSAILLLAFAILGVLEFYRLIEIGGYQPSRLLGVIWTVALVGAAVQPQWLPLSLVLMAGLILTLVESLRKHDQPINHWFATAMGALYIGVLVGQVAALRYVPDGLWWILLGFLVTWANDTAAYFVGVTVGRHKLWPRISPKKTWEGTLGGWAGAALVGMGTVMLSPLAATYSPWFGLALGAFCGVLALLGDLSVSILKRQVGVKDSGHLFPGHGGVLDRMDSPLFVLPFIYQMVLLWQRWPS